jgi:hypothetical protein
MYTDKVFNKDKGKDEVHFVNQQYDFLMSVVYDINIKGYRLNCSEAEANEIGKAEMGTNFDLKKEIKEVSKMLGAPILVEK